jgi:hypothetical protein
MSSRTVSDVRSPESLLLLAAARGEALPEATADPLKLVAAAEAEGMTGLLTRAMGSRAPLALRTRAVLAEGLAATAMTEVHRVIDALRERGVRALAIKGPVLSEQLYGDPGLRSFSDIDLLVAREDAERGELVLVELGYRAPERIPATQRRVHRRFHYASLFLHDEKRITIDFHWGLGNPRFPLDVSFEDLWLRRDGITLGLVDAALFSAVHAAKHLWSRLEMLAQLAAVARLPVDFHELDATAVDARAARRVGLSFLLVGQWLGRSVPDIPRSLRLAAPVFDRVRGIVEENLFRTDERRVDAAGADVFLLLDRRRDALRALAVSALVPTHADWAEDGSALSYWLKRPLRLAFRARKKA